MISNIFIVYLWMLAHHVSFSYTTPSYFNNGTQRCNCKNDAQCGENGLCPFDCGTEYRGRYCQHVNMLNVSKPNKPELHDGDVETCPGVPYNSPLRYTFDHVVLFFWVYLAFDIPWQREIGLKLFDKNLDPIRIHPHNFRLNYKKSRLIKVSGDVLYKRLELTSLPTQLCSVDISQGRNLALSSVASQSKTTKPASLATDGVDKHSQPSRGYECAIAVPNTAGEIWWKATLLHEAKINIVRFETPKSSCAAQFLKVKTRMSSGQIAYNFDGQIDIKKLVHVLFLKDKQPVKEIELAVKRNPNQCQESNDKLSLCEVEILGEYHCPDGQYGPLCELTCPGCTRDLCDPDWGCVGGCKDENWFKHEDWCLRACKFMHGPFCQYNCSKNCRGNGHCDQDDGACDKGCLPGFIGKQCETPCLPDTFGDDCSKDCDNCKQSSLNNTAICDNVSGKCLNGCAPGYEGKRCIKKDSGVWSTIVSYLQEYLIVIIVVIVVVLVMVAVTCTWIMCKTPKTDAPMDLGNQPPLSRSYQPPNYQHRQPQLSLSPNANRLSASV